MLKKQLLFYGILSIAFVLFLISPFANEKAHAQTWTANAYGPYSWVDSGGIQNETALITVNGEPVYCIDPDLPAPYGGQAYTDSIYSDPSVEAILYYGYGGMGNEIGTTTTDYVKTWVALNNWIEGKRTQSYYANKDSGVWNLIQHAQNQDMPVYPKAHFSTTSVNTSISGNVQKSQTITFTTDPANSVDIPVPSQVTIHVGTKTQTGGTYTIKGGQSFYFTAPLTYGTTFKSGTLKASLQTYAGILYAPQNSYQRLKTVSVRLDPSSVSGFTVNFTPKTSKLTINYVNKASGTLLKTTSQTLTIGSSYTDSPINPIIYNNETYIPLSTNSISGTVGASDQTITFYYALQRQITVIHKDNRDGTILKQSTVNALQGSSYSYSPLTTLKKGTYTYRPVNNRTYSGTVGTSNITITFYYDVPLMQVKLSKLQIYTADATKGLPVNLNLAKTLIYPITLQDFNTAMINVDLYQGASKLITNTYSAKNLPTTVKMTIPAKDLSLNTNKPYTVKFENFNSNDIDVPSSTSQLTTSGYTSSQETINLNVSKTLSGYSFSRVVMTEITPTTAMKKYNETYKFTGTKIAPQKTGYGTEQNVTFSYTNPLNVDDSTSAFTFNTPLTLMDSYLNYPISGSSALIPMDKTTNTKTLSGSTLTRNTVFSFPHVNVEHMTGNLFTDAEVVSGDSRIKYDLVDGGRKFYSPIWANLGNYPVSYRSNTLGVNEVKVNLSDTLTLNAFMFAHMDSPTKSQDAILLEPIDANNPFPNGVPKGWTQSDINWLEGK